MEQDMGHGAWCINNTKQFFSCNIYFTHWNELNFHSQMASIHSFDELQDPHTLENGRYSFFHRNICIHARAGRINFFHRGIFILYTFGNRVLDFFGCIFFHQVEKIDIKRHVFSQHLCSIGYKKNVSNTCHWDRWVACLCFPFGSSKIICIRFCQILPTKYESGWIKINMSFTLTIFFLWRVTQLYEIWNLQKKKRHNFDNNNNKFEKLTFNKCICKIL